MTPLPILFKNAWRKGRVQLIPEPVEFRYFEKYRVTHTSHVKGFGDMRHRVGTGQPDKSRVYVRDETSYQYPMSTTKVDIGKTLRRIRPQEAEQLAAVDTEIDAAKQRLRDLNEVRQNLLKTAFAKGHVITIKEVTERADAELAEGRMS